MAKKPELKSNLFAKTDTGEKAPARDNIKSRGIGLRESEWAIVDGIAAQTGGTYHDIAVQVMRDFVQKYQAGEIKLQPANLKKLEL